MAGAAVVVVVKARATANAVRAARAPNPAMAPAIPGKHSQLPYPVKRAGREGIWNDVKGIKYK